MNFDPRTEANIEEEQRKQEFDDIMDALRYLLENGYKRAAILLIDKCFGDKE